LNTVKLGQDGPDIGAIAYGCWRFATSTVQEADSKIRTALDCGMTLIDTADIYGMDAPGGFGSAESVLGEVLKANPSLREAMVLATKGGIIPPRPYNSSYDYLTKAMDRSLARLKVDYVDLYQIHRPDLTTPFEETARALNDMIKAGKTKYIGISNFTVSQTRALQAHLDHPLVTLQPEFSALEQAPITNGVLDYASETSAAVLAWSPLAGGRLATGRPDPRMDDRTFANIIGVIDRLCDKHKATRTQIALAFIMSHQAKVVPIIGTQNVDRIKEAASAAHVALDARDFYDMVEANRGVPMP
jgi:aryl-alcohol dehydrogenase-like predicted oxidoreductase